MELFTTIIVLSIFLSFNAGANSQQILVNSPKQKDHDLQLTLPPLPRKLRLIDETNEKAVETTNYVFQNKQEEALSGKFHQTEENLVHAKKGTRQEWKEGTDSSQFFTMDYSHVRRRRPIHNKFTPTHVAP